MIDYHEAWKVEISWFLLSPPELAAHCFVAITWRIYFVINEAVIRCHQFCERSTVLI